MLKYAFHILSLLISVNSSSKENQDLHVFLGAGCGYANEALHFLNLHHHNFDRILIYVLEDSLYTVKKLNLSAEDLELYEWHFSMKKQFSQYKIKKVPSFVYGALDIRKREVLTLPKIEKQIQSGG